MIDDKYMIDQISASTVFLFRHLLLNCDFELCSHPQPPTCFHPGGHGKTLWVRVCLCMCVCLYTEISLCAQQNWSQEQTL